ncbi:DUF2867 domain-containing protein (plasmid) [Methylocystis sp. MJC1]|uniref:DUF2867 domain-containing protein n=1 Tax=Methylocystis sp. MJC1 TaxID=2654282 RepID=UPI0013EA7621|nr:DUF2867 domain-containing protein [Methylocystis sp. MJC1]KAF2989258.1 hypothetical protein MJC1_03576 [Methylocystis sp. MJC1]MBU6529287.1 DUF2867 domain-containing protein [Methylocystis sp. MJC1]UZX14150.1 DUF2867 domain-containing protein [Methylocystis sp. MJC1]
MNEVLAATTPGESALRSWLAHADFHDAWSTPLRNGALTPTEIFLRASRTAPAWIGWLMALRNWIVRQIGLKDVGSMSDATGKAADAYRIGDRLGIFTIMGLTANELLLGIDDSHLDVRVSVMKTGQGGAPKCVVSTIVLVHKWIGHVYMVPVGRIHPLVVKAMLRRAEI